ncbi:3865_t:CDS:2 [Entrophospora sp. SA101]|nr:14891_t:CDS:2 [Entrophospora sp. SA101]CAJ0757311.1 3865_t:CDS:2 [Entrophospora sp. SA101]CAJ0880528.1 11867_t:CDS:2 [Entrophospora sp. SA101]CAJ0913920.1 4184_t:CDS:2 [Entrophospora sp. SA101]
MSYSIEIVMVSANPTSIENIPSSLPLTNFHTNERFIVPFNYVDITLKNNSAIAINLKVKDNKLIVNNASMKLGITSFHLIKAKVIPADLSIEEIDGSFDNYDIAVRISSSIESFQTNINGLEINRIIISMTVVEVGGLEVIHVERIEKILLLEEDYSFASFNRNQLKSYIRHWWRCSSIFTRTLWLAIAFITFATFIASFIIVASTYRKYFFTTTGYYQLIPNDFYDYKRNNKSFEKVIYMIMNKELSQKNNDHNNFLNV